MGVKGLWTILAPFCERKPLYEIRGETVAVDLSGWVCDSQNVTDYCAQPRLYLRNLYFRTSYLLLHEVVPVFVLEGEAPALKAVVMAARAQAQALARGGAPRDPARAQNTSRKRFATVLGHCEKLLSSMGLQCVTGVGEAEAMCAHLNQTGEVTAVISQDSDCFVYGATRLYRNFTVSGSGAGTVDVYDLKRVQQSMDLGRNKMVALALLCGSDYNGTGVDGVGHSSATSFIMQYADQDVIARLLSWSTDPEQFEKWQRKVDDVTSCTNCGHGGSVRLHSKRGCASCGTHDKCHSNGYKEWRLNMKSELQMRGRCLAGAEAFPSPSLLHEFLDPKESTPHGFCPKWGRPDLIKFTKLMKHWLCWTESYCVEKFLPLVTRWQLLHPNGPSPCPLQPQKIKKKRNPKGVACYEVVWEDPAGYYSGLVSDDQVEGETELQDLWTTVERQDLVEAAHPQLVEDFKKSLIKEKPKKKPAKKKATKENIDELETSMRNLSMEGSHKSKKGRKRKQNGEASFKTKTKKTRKKNVKDADTMQKKMDVYLAKPLDGLSKTLDDLSRPLDDLSKPLDDLSKPLDDLSKPLEGLSKPLYDLSKPLYNLSKPSDDLSKPLDDFYKSLEDLAKPLDVYGDEPISDLAKFSDRNSKVKPNLEHVAENIEINRDVKHIRNDKLKCKSPMLSRKKHLFENANTTAELLKNMSLDCGDDDISESELSNIVENIITGTKSVDFKSIVNNQFVKENQNYSTPVKSNNIDNDFPMQARRRESYFFGGLNDDYDAFEKSMDLKNVPDSENNFEIDQNETVNYDLVDYSPILTKKITRSTECYDSNVNKCSPVIKKKDSHNKENRPGVKKVLSLEERLFGKIENSEVSGNFNEISSNINFLDSPLRDASTCSTVYTPLLERIKKAKKNVS